MGGQKTATGIIREDVTEMGLAATGWPKEDQVRAQPLIGVQQHTYYRCQFRGGDEAITAVTIAGFQVERQLQ
jgi:hypothetical protein